MKVFISQETKDKTQEKIIETRAKIEKSFSSFFNVQTGETIGHEAGLHFIDSLDSEPAFENPIFALSDSLNYLGEADVVLVPMEAGRNIITFYICNTFRRDNNIVPSLTCSDVLKGCEFEFLIAKSYGKRVYVYDKDYNFEKVNEQ